MARLIVSAAVGIAVGMVAGPQAGFAAFSATYGLTGFLDPAQQQRGPKLDDLKGTTAQYGTPIPHVYGHPRVAGAIVWCSDKQTVENTESAGGKGGPSTEVTTYTYKIDVRFLLSANPIGGVRRIWSNGKLVWSQADDADAETIEASAETDAWERMTVYTGAANQMPDPVEEAALGIENCLAYRGRGSVFIEGLNLGGSGYLPNLTFELGTPVEIDAPPVETFYEVDTSPYGSIQVGSTTYEEGSSIYSEVTGTAPPTITIRGFTPPSETPSIVTHSLAGVGPGGVTPQRGTGDVDALIFTLAGTLYASYGGAPSAFTIDLTGVDDVAYLIDGSSLWISASNSQLHRLLKTGGGAQVSNLSAPKARTLALIGSHLYGADTAGTGQLIKWDAETLVEVATYDLAVNRTGMLCTDGTDLYDIAGNALVRWVPGTDTWETVASNMGQIATFAGTSGELPNPVIRGGFIYITRFVGNTLTTLRAPIAGMGLNPQSLEEVLTDLSVRSGIPESYLDFSSCSAQLVRALAVSQVTPARTVMQMLADANQQEFVESGGVLKTVARGGASVATIPYDKLGASQGDPVEPLPLKRLNDIELPRQVAITYSNTLNDYQNGTEYSDRLLGGSTSVATTELSLGMQPQEAKRLADFKLTDAVAGITQIGPLGLTREYARLEPTDVITPTDHTGSTFRARILKITDDGGLRTLECVLDDASAVNSQAVTDEDYESSTIVRSRADTELALMDIPILRDADNDAGIYAAVTKSSNNGVWPGAVLFKGINDTGWTEQATYTDRTFIGSTTTALPAWSGGAKFDEVSSVTVSGVGTLQSYTRNAILNGTANGYLIGSEVLYARTATPVSDGVYTLTGLLRGRRGTEWAAAEGAAAGSRVVLLQNQGIRRIDFQTGELGAEYDFRAVTAGRSIGTAVTESLTPEGVGLKPFSPANLRVSTVGGVQTLTWSRRTRLSMSPLGTCPLGETSESYDVEVRNGSDQIVLTATVNEQSCELGGLGQSFTVAAAQRIRQVGTDYIGVTDAYPAPSSTRIIREDSDGQPAGSAPLGKTATALINNGDDIYVAVINGSSPAYVYRIQRTDINTSFLLTTSATYSPANAADPQGLAFDGTNVWVSGFYSGTVKKLNASTLAEVNSYAINGGIGAMVYEAGSLWICDRANNEVIEWDTATQTEVQRIACNGMPTDVFVANGLVFVAANQLQVFDAASGIQEASYVSGLIDVFRQVIQHDGSSVVFADLSSSQLVFLDDSTGDDGSRTGVSGLMGVSGYGGGNLFASTRSGSVVTTSAYESIAGLTGHTATVYQNSETVGRGYPASIEL